MGDLKEFAKTIANFTPSEATDLMAILKDDYGIEPVNSGSVVFETEVVEEVVEKTAFDVVLTSAGASKLGVVKIVKTMTGLGLREAKELVDSAPSPIKEGVSPMEANALKAELEAAGASVDLV